MTLVIVRHLRRLEIAVCGSNCHADSTGRSAVHDGNTVAIPLAACQEAHRVQYTHTCALGIYDGTPEYHAALLHQDTYLSVRYPL